jgi:LETM1 and EF-hand domain-containing protein 1
MVLQMKIEMARFLQETVEDMAKADKRVSGKGDDKTPTLAEFADLLQRIRGEGGAVEVTTQDIVRFSKVFEDTLTLDNLSKPQLVALCRMLGLNTIGTSQILRFQLRIKLRHLRADDTMIMQVCPALPCPGT